MKKEGKGIEGGITNVHLYGGPTSLWGRSKMTSPGKGGRSTKTVTSIVSECKFFCFHGDKGEREVWKWSFLR